MSIRNRIFFFMAALAIVGEGSSLQAKVKKKRIKVEEITDKKAEVPGEKNTSDAKKPELKKPDVVKEKRPRLGAIANVAYEAVDLKSDSKSSLDGFGFQGGMIYSLNLNEQFSIPFSSGMRMGTLSGKNDASTVSFHATSIYFGLGFDFWFNQAFGLGVAYEKDIFITGGMSVSANSDSTSTSKPTSSVNYVLTSLDESQYGFGARFLVTKSLRLDGDYFFSSGTIKTKATGTVLGDIDIDPVLFSGQTFRFSLSYFFL